MVMKTQILEQESKECQVGGHPYTWILTGNRETAGEIQILRQVFQMETQILIVISSPTKQMKMLPFS